MCNIFFYIVSFRLNTSCFFLQKLSKLKVFAKLAPVNTLKSCTVYLKSDQHQYSPKQQFINTSSREMLR